MHQTPPPRNEILTRRESEILTCIAEGLSSKQIAEKLFISLNTVNNHRKNMLAKTGARTSAELIFLLISAKRKMIRNGYFL